METHILPILTHINQCAVAAYCLLQSDDSSKLKNNPPVFQQRLCWRRFVTEKQRVRNFSRHLRMSMLSFKKLLAFIRPGLVDNDKKASGRGGTIIPELHLYATLRYLAGGSYLDIHYFCGISETSFYNSIWQVIDLINKVEALDVRFPETDAECHVAAEGFRSISSGDAIVNCVSAVDGLLVRIATPSKKEAKNVRSFFSGHYQAYGMNIQAACNHLSRFTFLGVAGPGVMSDREAIEQVPLHRLIENLPGRYCVIGDCAYRPTEHLVPIFGGASAMDPSNDNWNFYVSQSRIRIEMAFGLLKQKWGILNSLLRVRLKKVKRIMVCLARLHNFTINERLQLGSITRGAGDGRHRFSVFEEGMRLQHAAVEGEAIEVNEFCNFSANRIAMVERVRRRKLERPRKFH